MVQIDDCPQRDCTSVDENVVFSDDAEINTVGILLGLTIVTWAKDS
jgi:hypothetical protein